MTHQKYTSLFLSGNDQYLYIATNNHNLTAFFKRGGKIIGFHGLVRIGFYFMVYSHETNMALG